MNITTDTLIKPNQIYLIPANYDIGIDISNWIKNYLAQIFTYKTEYVRSTEIDDGYIL